MDKPDIKGDEVRRGHSIYLDALSKEVIDSFDDAFISDTLVYGFHDGHTPIAPMTASDVMQSYQKKDALTFSVRDLNDDACVGVCCLSNIVWQARQAEIMIAIVSDAHQTVDIVKDVIQTLLQFAYWEANLNRISVACVEGNDLLCEAFDALGFTYEGCLRQDVYRDGVYLDTHIYSFLQREWSR